MIERQTLPYPEVMNDLSADMAYPHFVSACTRFITLVTLAHKISNTVGALVRLFTTLTRRSDLNM